MIRTTLKKNKENGIDYIDIAYYTDENWKLVADLFPEKEKYYWNNREDHTDWDKLYKDYTERQVASTCLKYLRTLTKGKEPSLMIWKDYFIDLDCEGEIAYTQIEELIKEKVITGSNILREIDEKAKKKGCNIHKGYRYGENNIYYGTYNITDLIDGYFPCHNERGIDYCDNCGNCQ